eukprot:g6060.t1
MAHTACLGRANPMPALELVHGLLEASIRKAAAVDEAATAAEQAVQASGVPGFKVVSGSGTRLDLLHEEVYWLVLFAGHLLADDSDGERPAIPAPLNRLSLLAARSGTGPGADPLLRVVRAGLALVELD